VFFESFCQNFLFNSLDCLLLFNIFYIYTGSEMVTLAITLFGTQLFYQIIKLRKIINGLLSPFCNEIIQHLQAMLRLKFPKFEIFFNFVCFGFYVFIKQLLRPIHRWCRWVLLHQQFQYVNKFSLNII